MGSKNATCVLRKTCLIKLLFVTQTRFPFSLLALDDVVPDVDVRVSRPLRRQVHHRGQVLQPHFLPDPGGSLLPTDLRRPAAEIRRHRR